MITMEAEMDSNKFLDKIFGVWSFDSKAKTIFRDEIEPKLIGLLPDQLDRIWNNLKAKHQRKPPLGAIEEEISAVKGGSTSATGDKQWWIKKKKEELVYGVTMELRDIHMKKYKIYDMEDKELRYCILCAAYELLEKHVEPQFRQEHIYKGFKLDEIPQVSIDEIIELAEKNLPLWRQIKKNIKTFIAGIKPQKIKKTISPEISEDQSMKMIKRYMNRNSI